MYPRKKKKGHFTYIFGKKWYYRLKPDYQYNSDTAFCLLNDYPEEVLETKLLVGMETLNKDPNTNEVKHSRIFSVFDSYIELYLYQDQFEPDQRFFYEMILGDFPQKPHFDVDIKLDECTEESLNLRGELVKNDLVTNIIEVMEEYGVKLSVERDILIYTSHGSTKRSYHVVIHHYCHANHDQSAAFYRQVTHKMKPENAQYIDAGVYSSKQNFRLIGSQKMDSYRPKLFCQKFTVGEKEFNHVYDAEFRSDKHKKVELLRESLVSWVRDCQYLPSFQTKEEEDRKYNFEEIGDLSDNIIQEAKKLLEKDDFPFVVREIRGNVVSLRRLRPSFCDACKRIHEHENPYLLIVGEYVYFCCRRSGNKLILGTLDDSILSTKNLLEPDDEDDKEPDLVLDLGGYMPPKPKKKPKPITLSKRSRPQKDHSAHKVDVKKDAAQMLDDLYPKQTNLVKLKKGNNFWKEAEKSLLADL